jgi:hypothetical protein
MLEQLVKVEKVGNSEILKPVLLCYVKYITDNKVGKWLVLYNRKKTEQKYAVFLSCYFLLKP